MKVKRMRWTMNLGGAVVLSRRACCNCRLPLSCMPGFGACTGDQTSSNRAYKLAFKVQVGELLPSAFDSSLYQFFPDILRQKVIIGYTRYTKTNISLTNSVAYGLIISKAHVHYDSTCSPVRTANCQLTRLTTLMSG